MGFVFSSIEAEEKVLRKDENRNEIYEAIEDIDDIKSEAGLKKLAELTE